MNVGPSEGKGVGGTLGTLEVGLREGNDVGKLDLGETVGIDVGDSVVVNVGDKEVRSSLHTDCRPVSSRDARQRSSSSFFVSFLTKSNDRRLLGGLN